MQQTFLMIFFKAQLSTLLAVYYSVSPFPKTVKQTTCRVESSEAPLYDSYRYVGGNRIRARRVRPALSRSDVLKRRSLPCHIHSDKGVDVAAVALPGPSQLPKAPACIA